MGRTLHIALDELLRDVGRRVAPVRARSAGRPPLALPTDDLADDDALFADHDRWIGRGDGFFAEDPVELATRRLDMRGPLDCDPGPIEMDEADGDRASVILDLRTEGSSTR